MWLFILLLLVISPLIFYLALAFSEIFYINKCYYYNKKIYCKLIARKNPYLIRIPKRRVLFFALVTTERGEYLWYYSLFKDEAIKFIEKLYRDNIKEEDIWISWFYRYGIEKMRDWYFHNFKIHLENPKLVKFEYYIQ